MAVPLQSCLWARAFRLSAGLFGSPMSLAFCSASRNSRKRSPSQPLPPMLCGPMKTSPLRLADRIHGACTLCFPMARVSCPATGKFCGQTDLMQTSLDPQSQVGSNLPTTLSVTGSFSGRTAGRVTICGLPWLAGSAGGAGVAATLSASRGTGRGSGCGSADPRALTRCSARLAAGCTSIRT